jgi:hypothetical protein
MSFGEELEKIDTSKIGEIFDDVIKSSSASTGTEANDKEFIENEIAKSDVQYPVFQELYARFLEYAPNALTAGFSQERVHGMLMGMYVTQLVLSNYAEREIPDTFPGEGAVGI